jgi:DNA-binding transcriptional ArsR family regulator
VDATLKALAEPRRRAIVRLVWSQELAATDIANRFRDVTRPAISQHLSVLKDANLVTERREGTRRLYRANRDTMAELRAFLDDYWTTGLERLRDVAQTAETRKRQATHVTPKRAPRPTKATKGKGDGRARP